MGRIGGNITGIIQKSVPEGKNEIGEAILSWVDVFSHNGWLGLQSGDSGRASYHSKVEESTHVFLCDFHDGIYALAGEDLRMIIKGKMYDVTLIDNPDEMDEQLEIFLKFIGGQNV